jgi:predicted amidohydrolase
MSKFMGLCFSLEQVATMATHQSGGGDQPQNQAWQSAGRRAGRVTVVELVEVPASFVDIRNDKRDGKV